MISESVMNCIPFVQPLMLADASWVITASVTKVHTRAAVGYSVSAHTCFGCCHHDAMLLPGGVGYSLLVHEVSVMQNGVQLQAGHVCSVYKGDQKQYGYYWETLPCELLSAWWLLW